MEPAEEGGGALAGPACSEPPLAGQPGSPEGEAGEPRACLETVGSEIREAPRDDAHLGGVMQGRRAGGGGGGYLDELKGLIDEAAVASVSEGTKTTCTAAWRQWSTFCRIRKRSPYLLGETRREQYDDEEELLLFAVHLRNGLKRTCWTLRREILGIRSQHVMSGEADPFGRETEVVDGAEWHREVAGPECEDAAGHH